MKDFFTRYKRFAVVGLSRDPKAFSRSVCQFLAQRGCELYIVNPRAAADDMAGFPCYRSPDQLPDVDGAIFFTQPHITVSLLPDYKARGIQRVWFQQGAADQAVLKKTADLHLEFMNGCVFMYNPDTGFPHNFHTFLAKLFHTY